ncbi:T9SS type A sorting domain-containing protein [Hymenobacter setariae]|uniref:T9SS type A sorting domain-containing protein n=1 Tax=Hymenobacter setariae TaxID=2594794 RepID=A0A558BPM9_9BACT|nr:T9SS type A sorting domain-containing protein [Hymenobacter setariae]TVT38475.1 T9SS type A sorting domain-containing protein [Hymenobacter setariae]
MRFNSIHLALWLVGLLTIAFGQQAVAQVIAPTQGGMVNATKVTATTTELIFGSGGNGQGRIVAVAPIGNDTGPIILITDNQFYTASTTYSQGSSLGKGYAVYSGSGRSVVVTGLQPRTSYYIMSAEYNTDGNTISYNTNGSSTYIVTSDVPKTVAPLPVELTSFTGTTDSRNTATLHWATASERNTAYFALESSTNNTSFTEVGRVAAAGNSRQASTYQWSDPQHLAYTTYYRLRQVDSDGSVSYSSVVTLAPTLPTARKVEIYPNPSAGQTMQVLLQGYAGESLELRVVDTMGRSVAAQTLNLVSTYSTVPLMLPQGLTSGTYVLTLAGSGTPVQKRITISN